MRHAHSSGQNIQLILLEIQDMFARIPTHDNIYFHEKLIFHGKASCLRNGVYVLQLMTGDPLYILLMRSHRFGGLELLRHCHVNDF